MRSIDAVNIAMAEVGIKEYPPNSNSVKYNDWYYNQKGISGSAYPWCAVFISWLFKEDRDLCPRTASCAEMLKWFEDRGQIVTKPQTGDIVFFKYNTNNRRTNHVGLVVGVQGTNISTVEGNTSITSDDNGGAVMKRMRNNHIVAFARPAYDGVAQEVTPKFNGEIPIELYPTIRINSTGLWVVLLQQKLNAKGFAVEVDGEFGPKTKQAVIAFQSTAYDDSKKPLVKDGVVGQKTWRSLV